MSNQEGDVGAAVPTAQRSSWTQFVKSIASFSGDLSSMTAPPFILSPVSLTEYPSYWGERPELFAAIADGATAEERHIRVVKWFISTLKGQYTTRNEKLGSEKKPLNPVLGELFFGQWPNKGSGQQTLAVEQVSHHPPITAYYIENESKKLVLQGHNAQKTSFSSGSIIVRQIGHAVLTLTLATGVKETHLLTLPRLRIDGIWYGSPYIELTDSSNISSSSGYMTSIEYRGKGYFSGKAHSFKASIYPPLPVTSTHLEDKTPVPSTTAKYVVEGTWTETSKVKVGAMMGGALFTDVTGPRAEVQVAPVEGQKELESRKLWFEVARGIRTGDFELASREKSKIEIAERQKRKDEAAAKSPYKLQYFERLDADPECWYLLRPYFFPISDHYSISDNRLGKLFNAVPENEDTYIFLPSSAPVPDIPAS